MARKSPWERPNPKQRHTKLTAKSKAAARARALRAGRTYPNLIDNMYAAKLQSRGGEATAPKRTTKTTRKPKRTATTTPRRKRSPPRTARRS